MNVKFQSDILLRFRQKSFPIVTSLLIVFLFSVLSVLKPSFLEQIENLSYDFQVRNNHKPLAKEQPITIITIDDKSLQVKGRWPWPRKILADLVEKLFEAGATIIALDMTFPEAEENIAIGILNEIKKREDQPAAVIEELNSLQYVFNYDEKFAKSLALGDSLLGFVFSDQGSPSGLLPPPYLRLTPEQQDQLAIPGKASYMGNIDVLQKAAKNAGFINATPDSDGVLRFTNLLFRKGADVYASLALQAVSLYLLAQKIDLITHKYGDTTVLEGIALDQIIIPTDHMGRILIPYRGTPFSFPYVSASDVLEDKAARSSIEGKLIFIGFSAAALADNYPASVDPVFPGVEIHATVASGIIDQYLPYKPTWGRGVTTFLIVFIGIICCSLLPFLGAIMSCILCIGLTFAIIMTDNWLWTNNGFVLDTLLPLTLVWTLFILNLAWGYFTEAKKGKELKSIFGQYVPPAYLEEMMKRGGEINLEGESKELSVLFSDIRSFTSLSEKMSATELKTFLNRFFNPITEVIFNNKGTIDKYVGDMVMAFWGAPLEDPQHAVQAVKAALEMQMKLEDLNKMFLQENMPKIKIGIGVNTGLMNVGDMGSKFRRSYTVLGDAVNLGSRLEGQCKFYHIDIIVGENTWRQTKHEFAFRKIDKIKVKGKVAGIEIFQPVCKIKELTPELMQELEAHHRALDAYFQQDWEKASTLFEGSKASWPNHAGLYEVYLNRIANLRLEPFKEGWDGAYVSIEK